jgi:hypothetical protein
MEGDNQVLYHTERESIRKVLFTSRLLFEVWGKGRGNVDALAPMYRPPNCLLNLSPSHDIIHLIHPFTLWVNQASKSHRNGR